MLTKEQLEDRKNYIGASEVAAVLGLSRWDTPLSIWAKKTGAMPAEDSEELHLWLGSELEETVAKYYCKMTGKKVHRVNEAFVHPSYPFIRAHIDRKVDGESRILQCKTSSAWKAKEWDGQEIPNEYVVQEWVELACSGYERADIAVLIGNSDFKLKTIERDSASMNEIIKRCADFWQAYVEPKIFPHVVTKNDSETLNKLFPHGQEDDPISLTDDANRLIESIKALQQDKINLEGIIEKEQNELKAMLQGNAIGTTDRWRVTWKDQARSSINARRLKEEKPDMYDEYVQESQFRVLKINPLKEKLNV